MARRPRTWLGAFIRVKPQVRVRGPRVKTIQIQPALPYLGPFASMPARLLARALMERGYEVRGEVPMFGGNRVAGGMIADLYLPTMSMVVRVQGVYWHTRPGAMARDDAQSVLLTSRGLRVVDVWDQDILHRLEWVLRERIGARGIRAER